MNKKYEIGDFVICWTGDKYESVEIINKSLGPIHEYNVRSLDGSNKITQFRVKSHFKEENNKTKQAFC